MRKIRILIADTDVHVAPVLKHYLEEDNYDVILTAEGQKVIKLFEEKKFDFLITETSLPLMDAFGVVQHIRKKNKNVPIIFLSGKNDEATKIQAFENGADDYVTKPFSIPELLLRVKAIIRRCLNIAQESENIRLSNFIFNRAAQQLIFENPETKEQEITRLTIKEATLLQLFSKHINSVIPGQEILSKVWNNETYMHSRSLDVYITRLRRYFLKDPKIKITNKHGVGFELQIEGYEPVE
ncbi:MAG: response regulator transcription factor [Bacteroidales bacterium]|jgi:DNA-binding response OmpR family regulator|nr:response regulator transcription factor [Bacteroidales bacterium]